MIRKIKEINGTEIDDENFTLERPNKKPHLGSTLGRFAEECSYIDMFLMAFFSIIASSTYFVLAADNEGIGTNTKFLDALYFSFVTFTTVGYGDILPQGYGRIVSAILISAGLLFTALIIGKFASERQQTLLLLLHTSDCQRRIDTFSYQIQEYCSKFESASNAWKITEVREISKDICTLFEACSNYITFHANQSLLTNFGNGTALISLYKNIEHLQKVCIHIHIGTDKPQDKLVSARTYAIAKRCYTLMRIMHSKHLHSSKPSGYFNKLMSNIDCYLCKGKNHNNSDGIASAIFTIKEKTWENLTKLISWQKNNINPTILEEVLKRMPIGQPQTWDKHISRNIAQIIGISNSMSQKCIKELRHQNKLPKL